MVLDLKLNKIRLSGQRVLLWQGNRTEDATLSADYKPKWRGNDASSSRRPSL